MAYLPSRFTAVMAFVCASMLADVATVETTADAVAHAGKLDGSGDILTISGAGDAILIRFRTAMIERWGVQKAVVAVHLPNAAPAPSELLVTEVRQSWTENSKVAPALPSGTAVLTRPMRDGWCTFDLPPKVSLALATGAAESIAVTSSSGQTLSIHSRRTVQFMPYLLVRGSGPLIRPAQPPMSRR